MKLDDFRMKEAFSQKDFDGVLAILQRKLGVVFPSEVLAKDRGTYENDYFIKYVRVEVDVANEVTLVYEWHEGGGFKSMRMRTCPRDYPCVRFWGSP